jgi:hypothetical protein
MKITRRKEIIELVDELADLRQERKNIEKREAFLKSEIKAFLGEEKSMLAGSYVVTVSMKVRGYLNRELLERDLGDLLPYTNYTPYEQMDIKLA